MKKILLNLAIALTTITANAQNQPFPNGGFENWSGTNPDGFYTHKDGSGLASSGAVTLTKQTSGAHGGNNCIKLESKNTPVLNIVVNANLTTGYVHAPSMDKSEGFISTQKSGTGTVAADIRRVDFTSRPDSLVGWFKYTPKAGDADEKAKFRAILHTGHFRDPETPAVSANMIGEALYVSENRNYTEWTRFSVPFTYSSTSAPEYLMINITASNNQMTNSYGSILIADDLEFIYNTCDAASNVTGTDNNNGSITFNWTAPTQAPTNGYSIAVKPQGQTPVAADYVAVTNTSYTVTAINTLPLVTGTTYVAYVKSNCGSLTSTEVTGNLTYTYAPPAGCDAPTALTATESPVGKISFNFTAPTTAPSNGYLFAVKTQGTSPVNADFVSLNATSMTNITATTGASSAALVPGQTYTVTVKSDCGTDGISAVTTSDIYVNGGLNVNEINGKLFAIYSNEQNVVVDLSEISLENGALTVYDLSGKVLVKSDVNANTINTVALPQISKGIYLFKLEGNNVIKTGKFVF